jgi:hypothetical protein
VLTQGLELLRCKLKVHWTIPVNKSALYCPGTITVVLLDEGTGPGSVTVVVVVDVGGCTGCVTVVRLTVVVVVVVGGGVVTSSVAHPPRQTAKAQSKLARNNFFIPLF